MEGSLRAAAWQVTSAVTPAPTKRAGGRATHDRGPLPADSGPVAYFGVVAAVVPAGSWGWGTQPPLDGGRGTQPSHRPPSAVTSDACGVFEVCPGGRRMLSSRDLHQSRI